MVTATSTEVFDVEIGRLRKDGKGTTELFEAIRVAQTLGHDMSVILENDPVPPPTEIVEHDYEKRSREENSAVLIFYAERDET